MEGHVKIIHDRLKPFQCQFCDKTFVQSGGLDRHVKNSHEGIKAFSCQVCKKCFTGKQQLNIHRKTPHEKFSCGPCDKIFGRKEALETHLYYNGSFAQNQISCQRRSPFTFRRLCPLRRAYWLAHEVFQVKKIFPRIWRSLCAHFSISVSSRSIGIKVKYAPRKEARHISLTLSASQGLLARP